MRTTRIYQTSKPDATRRRPNMNTPNPLIPQGTFPDNRGRSHIRIAVFTILAVHIVLLGALLMAGCKKNPEDTTADAKNTSGSYSNVVMPPDSTAPPSPQTSAPVAITPVPLPPVGMTSPPPDNLTPPPPLAGSEYVVVKNDSFYTIAKKYGLTTKAIADLNPGVDSTKLKIGQKLKVPAGAAAPAASTAHVAVTGNGIAAGAEKTYVVKSGDTLMKIAKANGVSVKALRSVNGLKTDQIKVGAKLKLPSKASTPAAEPVSTGAVVPPTP